MAVWSRIWRSVPWCESNAYWFASSGPTGRCRRASLRLRNAASARPIALAIPACTAEAGSGTDAETTQAPGMELKTSALRAKLVYGGLIKIMK